MGKNEEKLYLVADETSAPYEDWENPFTRTEEDDAFDLKVAEKFGLVLEPSLRRFKAAITYPQLLLN